MYELAPWQIWQCIPKKVKNYYRIWKSERNFVQKSLWYFPWPISSVVPNSPTIYMQQHHGKRAKRRAALNAHNTTVARRNRATVSAVRAPPLRKVARYWREPSCRCSAVHCAMCATRPRRADCAVRCGLYGYRLHATLDFSITVVTTPLWIWLANCLENQHNKIICLLTVVLYWFCFTIHTYRTRGIITRGLYIFYSIYISAVYIVERFCIGNCLHSLNFTKHVIWVLKLQKQDLIP